MKVKRSAKGLKKIGLEDMYRLNRLSEEIDGRVHEMKLVIARNLGIDASNLSPAFGVPKSTRMDFSGMSGIPNWSMWVSGSTVCIQDGNDWSCEG